MCQMIKFINVFLFDESNDTKYLLVSAIVLKILHVFLIWRYFLNRKRWFLMRVEIKKDDIREKTSKNVQTYEYVDFLRIETWSLTYLLHLRRKWTHRSLSKIKKWWEKHSILTIFYDTEGTRSLEFVMVLIQKCPLRIVSKKIRKLKGSAEMSRKLYKL